LRSFEQRLGDFRARGIQIAAISADASADSRQLCQSRGYTYTFLSDPKTEVIRRYGVLHPRAGREDQDIARPAEFLVDRAGTIRWVNLTGDLKVRARPQAVLTALDALALD
jgi:peroxiredoxin